MPALPVAVRAPPAPPALIRLAAGRQRRTIWLRRPSGVVLLSRMILPRGATATLMAEIPHVAGIAVDTRNSPPNACRSAGSVQVCTRGQEWCPLPAARWRVTVSKRTGPAAVIRFIFVVGRPPANSG